MHRYARRLALETRVRFKQLLGQLGHKSGGHKSHANLAHSFAAKFERRSSERGGHQPREAHALFELVLDETTCP